MPPGAAQNRNWKDGVSGCAAEPAVLVYNYRECDTSMLYYPSRITLGIMRLLWCCEPPVNLLKYRKTRTSNENIANRRRRRRVGLAEILSQFFSQFFLFDFRVQSQTPRRQIFSLCYFVQFFVSYFSQHSRSNSGHTRYVGYAVLQHNVVAFFPATSSDSYVQSGV